MRTIAEVKVGEKIVSPRHGEGMVTAVTKRTVKVTFTNGCSVKNTYKTADAYFWPTDF